MKEQRLLNQIRNVEYQLDVLKKMLFSPEGIRIVAIHRDDFSYLEYWDGQMPEPIVALLNFEKVPDDAMIVKLYRAIDKINPNRIGRQPIEIFSDLPKTKMNEHYQKYVDILEATFSEEVDPFYLETLKGKYDVENNLPEQQ